MLIFKKEKHVRKLAQDHSATMQQCLEATRKLLADYLANDKEAFAVQVQLTHDIESKADQLRWEVDESLAAGAFLPTIRSDVYRLVESVDKLAGRGEDLAIFLSNQSPVIPAEFQVDLTEILALNLDCASQLHQALNDFLKPKGKLDELHGHTHRVGKLESEVDDRQAALMRRIFSSDLELSSKMHLGQLLEVICSISDSAEDVADELAFAAMKSVV
jgi:predicted phosphate transport protein (TIGR00153 family)